jgi:glycosyltransferase involved in cell wall biosynthesis
MNISIIIPNHSDLSVKRCIESIDVDCEIIISLNKPTNKLLEQVDIGYERPVKTVFHNEANLAAALNNGIFSASNDHVLLMDSDCIFEKGTIAKLADALAIAPLAKGVVEFQSHSLLTNIISKARYFHTSSQVSAYSPPLAFNKNIIKDIGYYFDEDIPWSEDLEFDYRIRRAKLSIAWVKSAVIKHRAVNIHDDFRSAFNYGYGYAKAAAKKKLPPVTPYFSINNVTRTINLYKRVVPNYGKLAAIYMCIWIEVYKLGIVYGNRTSTY